MRPKSITIVEQSETEKLVEIVNQLGLKQAAEKYGTNASSLSRWLRTQGFQVVREYRRKNIHHEPFIGSLLPDAE